VSRSVNARSVGDTGVEPAQARRLDPLAQLDERGRRTGAGTIESRNGRAGFEERVGPHRAETSERAGDDGNLTGQGKTACHERASSGVLFKIWYAISSSALTG